MQTKNIDLTQHWQKGIAFLILLGLGALVVKFLPIFIMAGVLGLGLIFHRSIWDGLKILSWHSTKKLIKNNVVYYLNKSYEYLQKEYREFKQATDEVGKDLMIVGEQIKKLQEQEQNAIKFHARTMDDKLKAQYEAETYAVKEQLKLLKPTLDLTNNQYMVMRAIEEMREQDLKLFKIKLDAQIQKYEILKNLNNASNKASKFIGDSNSNQKKEYQESMKQLERSVAGYMINIDQTNRKMLPELQKFQINQSNYQDKGREIINAYEQTRLKIN